MTLAPLLAAPLAVQIHVATVIPAFLIGLWLIPFSRKGSPLHRAFGALYLVLMTTTSIAAIFITAHVGPTLWGFGLIHLFVVLTLYSVFRAIQGIRNHDIPQHRRAVLGSFIYGIGIAGAFTFVPGRIMHAIFFG